MLHLPWPRHLVVLGMLGAGLTLLVGGTAIFSLAGTMTTTHEMGQLTRAQRLHQDADMMHDALRADVGNARQALQSRRSAGTDEGLLDTTEDHARQFRQDVGELHEMDLSPVVTAAVADLVPAQEAYIATGEHLVRSMLRTGSLNQRGIERFQTMFESLVTAQAATTVVLAEASAELEPEQAQHERVTTWVLDIG